MARKLMMNNKASQSDRVIGSLVDEDYCKYNYKTDTINVNSVKSIDYYNGKTTFNALTTGTYNQLFTTIYLDNANLVEGKVYTLSLNNFKTTMLDNSTAGKESLAVINQIVNGVTTGLVIKSYLETSYAFFTYATGMQIYFNIRYNWKSILSSSFSDFAVFEGQKY